LEAPLDSYDASNNWLEDLERWIEVLQSLSHSKVIVNDTGGAAAAAPEVVSFCFCFRECCCLVVRIVVDVLQG
jgi:hypothetical protein